MSESIQAPSTTNPKVLILTTLITAATTVAVSYVGMRRPGHPELTLPAQIVTPAAAKETPAPAPVKTQTIEGTILSRVERKPQKGVNVFLVPTGRLTGQTDPDGTFVLPDIPPGDYQIVVQAANGLSDFTHLTRNRRKANLVNELIELQYDIRERGEQ